MTKTTNYKNISWRQRERKWEAGITVKGVKYKCRSYFDEIDAVKAVDRLIISKGFDYKKLQILKPLKNEKL
jgi:hypothetical protein